MRRSIPGIDNLVDLVIDRVAQSEAAERLVDKFVRYLTRNGHVDRLVEAYTEHVLRSLEDSQKLRELVRREANAYLIYIEEHPELLEAVVEEQSFSVASSMSGTIRRRTVTADNVLESVVRRILGRRPRREVPLPPENVRRHVLMEPQR